MEIRQLISFLAVAEELHFGRAAKRLHMAQPPLSQQIRRLEQELGTRLFERSTRAVRLTSAGEALVEPARAALDSLRAAERAARAAGRGEVGRVRVGFAGASSHENLPPLALAVRRELPGVEMVLEGRVYSEIASRRILDGSLDLGFVHMPARSDGLATRGVAVDELCVAVSAGHRLAQAGTVRMADLSSEDFVSLPPDVGSSIHAATTRACIAAGFDPKIVQVAPDSLTQLALVATGVGVAVTLSSWRRIHQPGVTLLGLMSAPRLETALAWRADNESPALRAVLAVADRIYGEGRTSPAKRGG
ncbi:LysR family transcriptional regulator [Nocardioides sp. KR10-350]|uniref:LysR family transcriptional regulator n=1 Tax=Nocardioides cheoyonin TaxID=3156615 RepID=UPI0032B5FAFD